MSLGTLAGRPDAVRLAILFLFPTYAGLALFQWLPLAAAAQDSLLRFSPLNPSAARFVGLGNYVTVLTDPRFLQAALNTVLYILGKVVIQIPLGLLLAVLLNQQLKGVAIVRGMVFGALVISDAIAALIWNIMYDPDHGLFNAILNQVGIPVQPFLISTGEALPAVLASVIWKDLGFTVLILLAGLQSIPTEYFDAAAIDGVGALTRLWWITIPLLKRMLLLASFMTTVSGSRIFTPILLMTQGGPEDTSSNLVYYMYRQAFQNQQMGEALASAVLLIVLLIVLTIGQGRLLRTSLEY